MMFISMFEKLSPAFVNTLSRAVKVIFAAQPACGARVVPVELKAMVTTFIVVFSGLQVQLGTVMLKLMLLPPVVALFLMYTVLFVL